MLLFETVCAHAAVSGRGPKLALGGIGPGGAVVSKRSVAVERIEEKIRKR